MLGSVLYASLLIGSKKHTSRYAGFSSFCQSVDWKQKHTSRYAGFSSFYQSVDWKQKPYLEICWIQFFLPVCWLETKSIHRDVLDSVLYASLLIGNKKHTSRYAGFSSFCKSVDWKQKAYLEICCIQFFLPVCWLETKSIPRDVLESVPFASLLIGNRKHTSRYVGLSSFCKSVDWKQKHTSIHAGFSSFCQAVDWKQKAYLEMCWIQHRYFRNVSDPRPVQGWEFINLFHFLAHQNWKK